MIEIKITGNTVEDIHVEMEAFLRGVSIDGDIVDLSAIPAALKEQNPVETDITDQVYTDNHDSDGAILDKDKYPWDKRIHSSAETFNTDGTWKLLKIPKIFNKDKKLWHEFIERVRAELRGEPEADDKTPEQSPTTAENPEVTENPEDVFGNNENPAAGMQQKEETVTTVTEAPTNFTELMKFITSHKDSVTIANVNDICNNFGLTDLPALMKPDNADMIPLVYNSILEIIANGVSNES